MIRPSRRHRPHGRNCLSWRRWRFMTCSRASPRAPMIRLKWPNDVLVGGARRSSASCWRQKRDALDSWHWREPHIRPVRRAGGNGAGRSHPSTLTIGRSLSGPARPGHGGPHRGPWAERLCPDPRRLARPGQRASANRSLPACQMPSIAAHLRMWTRPARWFCAKMVMCWHLPRRTCISARRSKHPPERQGRINRSAQDLGGKGTHAACY